MASEASRLARPKRTTFGDLARAGIELGIARLRLDTLSVRMMTDPAAVQATALDGSQTALVERVTLAIPRVAAHLPWRADCLVQALAARRWLGRHGVETTLKLGVPADMSNDFEAHAWLTAGDRIVSGGDISGHVPFVRPEPAKERQSGQLPAQRGPG